MAVGDTARLIATLELRDKFSPTVKKALGGLASIDSRIDRTGSKALQAGQHLGIGMQNAAKLTAVGIGLVASQVVLGLNSLVKLEKATAQTEAVIKSTGGAAGVTAKQVNTLSEKFESLNATVGDEFIQAGQNMLLTFTNIRGKAFEPALQAILDLNTAMGKGPEGLTSTAIQVGKALNDPIKGLTSLTRVGVTFSAEQKAAIEDLYKFTPTQLKALDGLTKAERARYLEQHRSNAVMKAQKIILKELNKEFGGSFLAQGGTTAGKVAKFHDAIEDLQRTLAAGFLPVVSKVADRLSSFLSDESVIKQVEKLGTSIAGLFSDENLNTGANILKGLFQTAKDVAPALSAAAKVTGEVVRTAVAMFTSLPKELQTLLVGGLAVNKLTGGLVTNLAGGLISSVLKQLVSGVVNVNGAVVNVTGVPSGVGRVDTPGGMGAVSKVVTGGILIGGVALTADTIARMAAENAAAADRGLNGAEIAAQRYYTASVAEQQTIAKRLGYVPTRADFQSGTAKLQGSVDRTTTRVEGMRGLLGAKLDRVSSNTIAAGVAAKNASRNAGERARSGGVAAAVAIRNKELRTTVNVNTRVNVSGREWLAQATQTNIRGGAS